jgi:hypothetical protein
MAYSLNNIVSAAPENSSVGSNNSWIKIEGNTGRPLYAEASYVTNFDDINISLSASNLSIGSIEINDPDNHTLKASVASIGAGMGALRVLSQDLEPVHDTVSLGDVLGNRVGVHNSLSAMNVYVVNNPGTTDWGVLSASLAADGFATDNFTQMASKEASKINISNTTNKNIWVKKTTQNIALPLPSEESIQIDLISNTNEVALATESGSSQIIYGLYTKYNKSS